MLISFLNEAIRGSLLRQLFCPLKNNMGLENKNRKFRWSLARDLEGNQCILGESFPHSTWEGAVQPGLSSHLGKPLTLSSMSQALGVVGHFLIVFIVCHDPAVHMGQFLLAHALPSMCLRSDPLKWTW